MYFNRFYLIQYCSFRVNNKKNVLRQIQRVLCNSVSENFQSYSTETEILINKVELSQRLVTMASSNEGESSTVLEQKPTLSKRAIKRMERIERGKKFKKQNKTSKEGDLETDKNVLQCTEYYFENGLRKVYPYYFNFTTYVKERWFGREILEVFTSEFRSESYEIYKQAIENGSITVNGKAVSCDYKLKANLLLANTMHRHENPVSDTPIEIIADTPDLLVINKPSSIPCHPCGRYRFNSISFILAKEYGYTGLRSLYRLDRLTSGVLIMAKSHKAASKMIREIQNKKVQKEYVCRVVGSFPDGDVICEQPVDVISHKLGLRKVSSSGKDAKTTFQRLSYNGKTSVVKCIPHTGRTHQIRVHLQYLGYPIINDPFYNSEAFGSNKGKGGITDKTDEEIAENIMKLHNVGLWVKCENPDYKKRIEELKKKSEQSNEPMCCTSVVDDDLKPSSSHELAEYTDNIRSDVNNDKEIPLPKKQKLDTECIQNLIDNTDGQNGSEPVKKLDRPGFDLNKWIPDEKCDACKTLYDDPDRKDSILYLHALKYKGTDWEFSSPLPDWATEDWKDEDNG